MEILRGAANVVLVDAKGLGWEDVYVLMRWMYKYLTPSQASKARKVAVGLD